MSDVKSDPTPLPAGAWLALTLKPAGAYSVAAYTGNLAAFQSVVGQWIDFAPTDWTIKTLDPSPVYNAGGVLSLPNAVVQIAIGSPATIGQVATMAASVTGAIDCDAVTVCGLSPCSAAQLLGQSDKAKNPFAKCLTDPTQCAKDVLAVPLALLLVAGVAWLLWTFKPWRRFHVRPKKKH